MEKERSRENGERILALTPIPSDSRLICDLLLQSGFDCLNCHDMDHLLAEARKGAAIIFLTEEALTHGAVRSLKELLVSQPSWSDLPVVVLASLVDPSIDKHGVLVELLGNGRNLTILNRPVHMPALVSVLRSLVRSRLRQYETGDLLRQLEESNAALRASEAERELYIKKLERSNEEIKQFTFVASHDLQEPLRKIQTFGSRLHEIQTSLDKKGREDIERIVKSANRMAYLIRALRNYSDFTNKEHAFKCIDLAGTIREVIGDLEVSIRETEAQVEVSDLFTVQAFEEGMRQVFQNLIGNSIKYSKESERPIIKISGLAENGWYRIYVEDNGIGFDEQYLDQIFRPFRRLHGEKSRYEGTGMGLAICRRVVELHGGTITARSIPGEGSTFIITLPLEQKNGSCFLS
jgi:signal transduction histidine kinase